MGYSPGNNVKKIYIKTYALSLGHWLIMKDLHALNPEFKLYNFLQGSLRLNDMAKVVSPSPEQLQRVCEPYMKLIHRNHCGFVFHPEYLMSIKELTYKGQDITFEGLLGDWSCYTFTFSMNQLLDIEPIDSDMGGKPQLYAFHFKHQRKGDADIVFINLEETIISHLIRTYPGHPALRRIITERSL